MKKKIRSTIPAFLLLSALIGNLMVAQASQVMPLYTGIGSIISGLTISDAGKATCDGTVVVWAGYTADVTVELKRDGTTIKTWTNSGSMRVAASGTYYVASGHTYVVTTTADVYDSAGNWVATYSGNSLTKNY